MAEEIIQNPKQNTKPKNLWDGALKMVKGENTTQLIEQFTAEMTLVAEGLCEDQSKLHQDVEKMIGDEDRQIQKLQSQLSLIESQMDAEKEAHDRDLTELRTRLADLEKRAGREATKEKEKEKKKPRTIIRDLTVLVAIAAGAWVIVTIINKFF